MNKYYVKGCISCKYANVEGEFATVCTYGKDKKYVNLVNFIKNNKLEVNICEHWKLDKNI